MLLWHDKRKAGKPRNRKPMPQWAPGIAACRRRVGHACCAWRARLGEHCQGHKVSRRNCHVFQHLACSAHVITARIPPVTAQMVDRSTIDCAPQSSPLQVDRFDRPSRSKTQFHPNWATILPRTRRNILVNDVQGVREMIAGQVLVSAVAGFAATVATVVLSAPTLATLVAYPAVCSLTLLLTAAVWNIRVVHLRQGDAFSRAQA